MIPLAIQQRKEIAALKAEDVQLKKEIETINTKANDFLKNSLQRINENYIGDNETREFQVGLKNVYIFLNTYTLAFDIALSNNKLQYRNLGYVANQTFEITIEYTKTTD